MNEKRSATSIIEAMGQITSLWRMFIKQAGFWRFVFATGLALLGSLSEGLALLALIPLMQSFETAAIPTPAAMSWLPRLLHDHGVQLDLSAVLALFFFLAMARSVLNNQSSRYLSSLRLNFLRDTRVTLYSAITHANWTFLQQLRPADLLSALTAETDRLESAIYFALQMPVRVVRISAYIAAAYLVSPVVPTVAICIGFVLFGLAKRRYAESHRIGKTLSRAYENYHHITCDSLAGLKITKSYVAEAQHVSAFAKVVDDVRESLLANIKNQVDGQLTYEIVLALSMVAFFMTSIELFHMSIAQVLVLALILYRLLPLLQGLQESAQGLLHMAPAAEAVFALSRACSAASEAPPDGPLLTLSLQRGIRMVNVGFGHVKKDPYILKNVNLDLRVGTLTVLAGPSGAGKSTTLDLLAGLLKPDRGKIWIDDRELKCDLARAWRGSVAYVLQDSFLFNDTIRANLLIAKPEASEEELREALSLASAAGFVDALPRGLDTVVGNRGLRFSGGERQRLALARALLRKPGLLILDEPTSSLDARNERVVLEGIEALRGRMTMILVTHRPEQIANADRIVLLEDGITKDISIDYPTVARKEQIAAVR